HAVLLGEEQPTMLDRSRVKQPSCLFELSSRPRVHLTPGFVHGEVRGVRAERKGGAVTGRTRPRGSGPLPRTLGRCIVATVLVALAPLSWAGRQIHGNKLTLASGGCSHVSHACARRGNVRGLAGQSPGGRR